MEFSQEQRIKLLNLVWNCRSLLSAEFKSQLQSIYGIDPDTGIIQSLDNMKHLESNQFQISRILRETIQHYCSKPGSNATDEINRVLREQAFTILNRFVAIKLAERRGICYETISNGYESSGFQIYKDLVKNSHVSTENAYVQFIKSVFDDFSLDIPILFDRNSAQGQLMPRNNVLIEIINKLNDQELESFWDFDETIGWVYQYFNSAEERKKIRNETKMPRNSRELAVLNQFFTPRYVIEFLSDNSLGRYWLNQTSGKTKLREKCKFLLTKQDEKFEYNEQLRDPRTIKCLDPACGSMHFGIYIFDLLFDIYLEAWDWEIDNKTSLHKDELNLSSVVKDDFKSLTKTYENKEVFKKNIPKLILENNIYGVDIDPRCVQIASLALWLKAHKSWNDMGINKKERQIIKRNNIFAATQPPSEKEIFNELGDNLNQKDKDLFLQTLYLLKDLPELGFLLKTEKEIPKLIKNIFQDHGQLFMEQDKEDWNSAAKRLDQTLINFYQLSINSYQKRLFAKDALDGLKIINLSREVFDIVVMNPPFGALSTGSKTYLTKTYPFSKSDLLSIFVERGLELLNNGGRLAAITSRTPFFLKTYENWREKIVLGVSKPEVMADLGHGVMDEAFVEAAAFVLEKK